jgi:hypothetical protein
LITDKALLVNAAEITTVEARFVRPFQQRRSAQKSDADRIRHNTELNTFNGKAQLLVPWRHNQWMTRSGGSAIANAFDTVLTPQQVLSVAAPFISGGCDPVQALGLTREYIQIRAPVPAQACLARGRRNGADGGDT